MSIKVCIPLCLQSFTKGLSQVEVNGNTIGECLQELVKQFPSIERALFHRPGELDEYLAVGVNGEIICSSEKVLDKLVTTGDELYIIVFIAGG